MASAVRFEIGLYSQEGVATQDQVRGSVRDQYQNVHRVEPIRQVGEKVHTRGVRPVEIVHEDYDGLAPR